MTFTQWAEKGKTTKKWIVLSEKLKKAERFDFYKQSNGNNNFLTTINRDIHFSRKKRAENAKTKTTERPEKSRIELYRTDQHSILKQFIRSWASLIIIPATLALKIDLMVIGYPDKEF